MPSGGNQTAVNKYRIVKEKIKLSRYRPGQVLGVPGS
jgi:hypothetical protein